MEPLDSNCHPVPGWRCRFETLVTDMSSSGARQVMGNILALNLLAVPLHPDHRN